MLHSTLIPFSVLVLAMRFTMTSYETSGLPLQFFVMKENSLCSILNAIEEVTYIQKRSGLARSEYREGELSGTAG